MEGISAILARAIGHHQAGRLEQAVSEYLKLVAAGIRAPMLYQSLGAARLTLGETLPAIADFETALALDPTSAPTHANLGHALARLSRWREAAAAYARAFAADPNFVDALVERGI
jgi:tetratricopeptide (TPR) repeat protein